jgi:stalled ribosome rescue protein Dom34
METKKRTEPQNRSLHLWFTQLAEQLNECGYEKQITIGSVAVPWTLETVKALYKKIALHMYEKEHTSDLTTVELQAVNEVLNRALAEEGITHIPFPSAEEMMLKSRTLQT